MVRDTQKNKIILMICLCDIRWLRYRKFFKYVDGLYTTKSILNKENTTNSFERRIKRSLTKQGYITDDVRNFDDLVSHAKSSEGKLLLCSNETESSVYEDILDKYHDDVDLVFVKANHLTTLERLVAFKFLKEKNIQPKTFKMLFDSDGFPFSKTWTKNASEQARGYINIFNQFTGNKMTVKHEDLIKGKSTKKLFNFMGLDLQDREFVTIYGDRLKRVREIQEVYPYAENLTDDIPIIEEQGYDICESIGE